MEVREVDWSFWESTWSIPDPSSWISPQGNKEALSFSCDLCSYGTVTCPLHGLQEGTWIPRHSNGLQLETQAKSGRCWTGLGFNTEHKLWAFILMQPKTRLDFFHGETDRDRPLGSQEGKPLNFTSSVNHTTETHPPTQVSGILFL